MGEDEDAVRGFIAASLRRDGHEVVETADGLETVAAARTADPRPDLFLSDVAMPGLDGPAAAWEIRRSFPRIPVVFVSGHIDDPVGRERIAELGAILIRKPFRRAEPAAALDRLLGDRGG